MRSMQGYGQCSFSNRNRQTGRILECLEGQKVMGKRTSSLTYQLFSLGFPDFRVRKSKGSLIQRTWIHITHVALWPGLALGVSTERAIYPYLGVGYSHSYRSQGRILGSQFFVFGWHTVLRLRFRITSQQRKQGCCPDQKRPPLRPGTCYFIAERLYLESSLSAILILSSRLVVETSSVAQL